MSEAVSQVSLDEKPLVTFILFAYNQEKYIREAVLGAFSQTYEPLEIILSDDFSSDMTFEIMQEMAAEYLGTSAIVLNRNKKNLNIGGHVAEVSKIASCDIIVMAAGDDISYPKRVEEIVDLFLVNPNYHAVYSDYSIIDDEGIMVEKHHTFWNSTDKINACALIYGGGGVGVGASYAYRKKCFFWPETFPVGINKEDRILPWRAFFLGGIGYINTPLLKYRESFCSVSRIVSETNVPACKQTAHIHELKKILRCAWQDKIISNIQCRIYTSALNNLVSHMYKRDFLEIKFGAVGKVLSSMLKFFYKRYSLLDYLLAKIR